MSVVTLAKIIHKTGLRAQMPILASGEIGYAVDTQSAYIGSPKMNNLRLLGISDLEFDRIATNNVLGKVIIGSGFSIDSDGRLTNVTPGTISSISLDTSATGLVVKQHINNTLVANNTITTAGTYIIDGKLNLSCGGTNATELPDALYNLVPSFQKSPDSFLSISPVAEDGTTDIVWIKSNIVDYPPLARAGDTMLGYLELSADPINLGNAATKQYADDTVKRATILKSCKTATDSELIATYSNGSSGVSATLSGSGDLPVIAEVALSIDDRVLVKNQSDKSQNGIYITTAVENNWILTRSAEYDQATEILPGSITYIESGVYQYTQWAQINTVTAVGSSPIQFVQFAGPGLYSAGDGIEIEAVDAVDKVSNTGIVTLKIDADYTNNLGVNSSSNPWISMSGLPILHGGTSAIYPYQANSSVINWGQLVSSTSVPNFNDITDYGTLFVNGPPGGPDDDLVSAGSALFTSTEQLLTIPYNSSHALGDTDFTIECWIHPNTTGPTNNSIRTIAQSDGQWSLYINSQDCIVFTCRTATGWKNFAMTGRSVPTSTLINADRWSRIIIGRSGISIYGIIQYKNTSGYYVQLGNITESILYENNMEGVYRIGASYSIPQGAVVNQYRGYISYYTHTNVFKYTDLIFGTGTYRSLVEQNARKSIVAPIAETILALATTVDSISDTSSYANTLLLAGPTIISSENYIDKDALKYYTITIGRGSEHKYGSSSVRGMQFAVTLDDRLYFRFKSDGNDTEGWSTWQQLRVEFADTTTKISGVLSVAQGGTDETTAEEAIMSLLPPPPETDKNSVLVTDGSNVSWNPTDFGTVTSVTLRWDSNSGMRFNTGNFVYDTWLINRDQATALHGTLSPQRGGTGNNNYAAHYPYSIAVDPTGRFVYVANYGSDTIGGYSINDSTGALTYISTVATGSSPRNLTVDPTGRFVYVTNNTASTVSGYTINQTTGALTPIGIVATGASPLGVAVDPTGRFVYLVNYQSNTISMYTINQTTGALTSIGLAVATGSSAFGIAVDPTGRFVYVANYGSNTVGGYTINQATGALTSIGAAVAAGSNPYGVAVDPSGRFVYVTNQASLSMYAINQTTGALTSIGTVATGLNPYGVAVDPSGRFVYVANSSSNSVSMYAVNQTTGALTSISVAVATGPQGVVVDPNGRFVYVTNVLASTISGYTINQTTGALTLIGAVPAGNGRLLRYTGPDGVYQETALTDNYIGGVFGITRGGTGRTTAKTALEQELMSDWQMQLLTAGYYYFGYVSNGWSGAHTVTYSDDQYQKNPFIVNAGDDFTIEFFYAPTSYTNTNNTTWPVAAPLSILDKNNVVVFAVEYPNTSNAYLQVKINNTAIEGSIGTSAVSAYLNNPNWYHTVVTRRNGTVKFYINGKLSGSAEYSDTISGNTIIIGSRYAYLKTTTLLAGRSMYEGYISSVRISRETAIYPDDEFAPPTSILPVTSSTSFAVLRAGLATRQLLVDSSVDDIAAFGYSLIPTNSGGNVDPYWARQFYIAPSYYSPVPFPVMQNRSTVLSDSTYAYSWGNPVPKITGKNNSLVYNLSGALKTLDTVELDDNNRANFINTVPVIPGGTIGTLNIEPSTVFAPTEAGKRVLITSAVTVTANTFKEGDVISLYNNTDSTLNIIQGTGLVLILDGYGTTGNRILLPRGTCAIWFYKVNEAIISGKSIQ